MASRARYSPDWCEKTKQDNTLSPLLGLVLVLVVLFILGTLAMKIYRGKVIENTANTANIANARIDQVEILENPRVSSRAVQINTSALPPEKASDIATELNVLLATIDALCIKTRGFTMNLVTKDFYEFHSFFNLTIDYLQKASYEVAERTRSLGPMANTTVADVVNKSLIRDAQAVTTNPSDMVAQLLQDYITIANLSRGIFRMASAIGDAGTIALMTKTTLQLEHFQWELRVMSGKYSW